MKTFKPLPFFIVLAVITAGSALSSRAVQSADIRVNTPVSGNYHLAENDIESGAKTFIGSMAKRGIAFLADESLSHEERKNEFQNLLRDAFAMRTIGRFALGRYWRTASDSQKETYLSLFEDHVLEVYSNRFNEYNGQNLEVEAAQKTGSNDIIVSTNIVQESGPKIRVDWRVRYKNSQYKVIDVIVEGVSMAVTQRSDFASVIQRGGGNINVLLDHLKS